jgi:hypothetical protein
MRIVLRSSGSNLWVARCQVLCWKIGIINNERSILVAKIPLRPCRFLHLISRVIAGRSAQTLNHQGERPVQADQLHGMFSFGDQGAGSLRGAMVPWSSLIRSPHRDAPLQPARVAPCRKNAERATRPTAQASRLRRTRQAIRWFFGFFGDVV